MGWVDKGNISKELPCTPSIRDNSRGKVALPFPPQIVIDNNSLSPIGWDECKAACLPSSSPPDSYVVRASVDRIFLLLLLSVF